MSDIYFFCSGCGLKLSAPAELLGVFIRCDECNTKQEVIDPTCVSPSEEDLVAPIDPEPSSAEEGVQVAHLDPEVKVIQVPPQEAVMSSKVKPPPVSTVEAPAVVEPSVAVEEEAPHKKIKRPTTKPPLQGGQKKKKSRLVPRLLVLVLLGGAAYFFKVPQKVQAAEFFQKLTSKEAVEKAELEEGNAVASMPKPQNLAANLTLQEPAKDPQELNAKIAESTTSPVKQLPVKMVEKMVQIPKPLILRDWYDVSQKYYKYVMRTGYELDGKLLLQATPKGKKSGIYPIDSDYLKTKSGQPGWDCQFYTNQNFEGDAAVVRVDEDINFKWGHKKPLDEIARDNFSVRWTTTLTVPETRKYKFSLDSDDGARLLIDGKGVMGRLNGMIKVSKSIQLEKGRSYNLTLEYIESSGEAKVLLNWDFLSAAKKAEMMANAEIDLRMPTYRNSKPGGEIFSNVSTVIGAKMVGLDPKEIVGFDILKSVKHWYDPIHGLYRHGPGQKSADLHSGIYGYWSAVYGIMLASLFPEDPDFHEQAKTATTAFLKIAKGLGCPDKPNFDTLGFNFDSNGPGGRNEPMNRLGNSPIVAWMNLLGYGMHKNPEMLTCAKSALQYYQDHPGRYELTHVMAPYVGARLNAEYGENFDMDIMYNAWFGDPQKYGWSITSGYDFDGVTADGLDGAVRKNGSFLCFTMGSLNGPAWLLPALRYDQRYARAVGKYSLNMAVSMRLMQGYEMDWDHQDHKDWKDKYDPEYLLFYEALGSAEFSDKKMFSPYATGDPIRLGWLPGKEKVKPKDYLGQKKEWFSKDSSNMGMYMGHHVYLLGGICQATDVPGIIRWDCLKAEWYHPEAYPTFLYFNPHSEVKEVSVDLTDKIAGKVDLYDSIQGKFIATGIDAAYKMTMNADTAAVIVAVPQGSKVEQQGSRLLVNGIAIDYRVGK